MAGSRVATALLMRLVARAQANGIQRFGAAPLPDNLAAAELLGAANAVRGGESRSVLLEFEMDLTDLDEAHAEPERSCDTQPCACSRSSRAAGCSSLLRSPPPVVRARHDFTIGGVPNREDVPGLVAHLISVLSTPAYAREHLRHAGGIPAAPRRSRGRLATSLDGLDTPG